MLVSELKGLNQTQGLLNRASHWQVIDCDLSQGALWVDDEQTPEIRIKEQLLSHMTHKGTIRDSRRSIYAKRKEHQLPLEASLGQLTLALLFLVSMEVCSINSTCRQCPHLLSGLHNLWRWCAVCQIPKESSWPPDRPAYVVCSSFENTRKCKFATVNLEIKM